MATTGGATAEPRLLRAVEHPTLVAGFVHHVRTRGDAEALRDLDGERRLTWREYGRQVARLAAGLRALGVRRGDTVGLMMGNRVEFHLLDTAALMIGAIPFSLYNSSSTQQIEFVSANAGQRVMLCERSYADRIRDADCPALERVVEIDRPGDWEALERAGREVDLESCAREIRPDDVATLIYTSGTTGPPKGVELTHANLVADWSAMLARLPMREHGRVLSYLPCAHLADRFCAEYAAQLTGATVTCVADPARLVEALGETRPTMFAATPRIWEKFHTALRAQADNDDLRRRALDPETGDQDPAVREARMAMVRQLGLDALEWAVSGSAPIAPSILRAFAALGVPISEIWGMTEIGCVGTANPLDDVRYGTVGPPLPGVEARLADDDELLIRGATVMRGYRRDPERTAEALDADGWLHTGDVARIEDGYVRIIDRKKDLIITSTGKNLSPVNIERALASAGPLIGQACVVGDRRPHPVALVVLDPDGAAGLDPHDPETRDLVEREVEAANRTLSRPEQVRSFALLADEWLPDSEELTPTMKLKRRAIASRYAQVIDGLYGATVDR